MSTRPFETSGKPTRKRFAEWGSWLLACVEALADGVVVSDDEGVILFVNTGVERMLGVRREELLGRRVEVILPERYRAAHVTRRLAYLEQPRPRLMGSGLELVARRADGTELPVEVSLSHMETEEGVAVVSVIRDISERVQARRALEESESRARLLLENLPDGVTLVTEDRLAYVNPSFCRMVGRAREDVIDRPVLDFLAPGDRPRARERIAAILGGAETQPNEYELRRENGSQFSVEALSHPVPHRGRISLLTIFRDLTKRKEADVERERWMSRLQNARKMSALGTLAAGIGHDFNNVLQSILGYGGMALEDAAPHAEIARNVDKVLKAADRGRSTVRRLLGFSRQLQSGRRPVQLEEILSEALASFEPTLATNVRLRWSGAVRSSPALGDPAQIFEVIMNLLTNASDAVRDSGGSIEVATCDLYLETTIDTPQMRLRPGTFASVRVRDTGIGVDPEDLDRIFEPFFTTKDPGRGDGLGLAVAHGIATQHGGGILVTTRAGRGASFEVLLPVARRQSEGPLTR